MRVAVSGASGFIGRYVLMELERQLVDVVALTRDSSQLTGFECEIAEVDILNPNSNCFDQLGRPDTLIHLAWNGLTDYQSMNHIEIELPAQLRFLKLLLESGLSGLLVAGTCLEYGMQHGPLPVTTPPQPITPYAKAKDALRKQLELWQSEMSFNLTWARLFYMYGEGQSERSLYSQLQAAVLKNDTVFNMSGGEQLRDYLPVNKVATKIVALAINQSRNHTVNICSGEPISVRRLVEQWVEDQGSDIQLNLGHDPYPDYEPMAFWGS